MWDVLWEWVLSTNGGDATLAGFSGFGHGIITRIEVFALLKHKVNTFVIRESDIQTYLQFVLK